MKCHNGPALFASKYKLTGAYYHRSPGSMADRVPCGISWSTFDPPDVLFSPAFNTAVVPADSYLSARHDTLYEKRARNALHPPLFSGYDACFQHLPQFCPLLVTLGRQHGILDLHSYLRGRWQKQSDHHIHWTGSLYHWGAGKSE